MNFLADESCAGPVIQALREWGRALPSRRSAERSPTKPGVADIKGEVLG